MKTTISTLALALASMTFGFAQAPASTTPAPAGGKAPVTSNAKTTKRHTRKVVKGATAKAPSTSAASAAKPAPAKQ